DFPAPGAPVRPITRVPAAAGFRPLSTERARASPFSTHVITRPMARLSPAVTSPAISLVSSVVICTHFPRSPPRARDPCPSLVAPPSLLGRHSSVQDRGARFGSRSVSRSARQALGLRVVAGRGTTATIALDKAKIPFTLHEYEHDPRSGS